jgi:tRNA A-37 threonylcarbamoyl transferase component Bud32
MQQQASLELFCEECGAANAGHATNCIACNEPLSPIVTLLSPAKPVVVVRSAPLQVTAGAAAASPAGMLRHGALLHNRYRIVGEIGQGGFARVYKARDMKGRNRLVAIKQIDLNLLNPREIIEATDGFNREIKFLSTLDHPNLPKIYDHFTDPGHWYMVMEYIKGRTLEEHLQQKRHQYLPLNQVLKIGLAVMDVLGYLHSQRPPVIFRDVKPANIMLTRRGRVYLIDFGIARRFAPEKKKDTGPLGSPGYAAPEQYGSAQTDARTDIYGLGATLQTLFTGRDPLELRQGLPSLRPKPLPAEFQTLVDSMLEVDPEKRPERVADIEERFAWWARRVFRPLEVGKGLLIGIAFWSWYWVLNWWVYTVRWADFGHVTIPPLSFRLLLLVVNIFPVAILGTAVFQIGMLFNPKKRQMAIALLAILALMLFFSVIGWMPNLFDGYPYRSFTP